MNTEMQPTNAQNLTLQQTQLFIWNQKSINFQFAEKIIHWYFSRYKLNWNSFLEAKRIAVITQDESFVSKIFQFR